jgi:hypothetical protein
MTLARFTASARSWLAKHAVVKSCSGAGAHIQTVLPGRQVLRDLLAVVMIALSGLATAAQDFSSAERALFMTNHLDAIRSPTTLNYTFRRSGSLGDNFDDKVSVKLTQGNAGSKSPCCTAATEFLTGQRRIALPEIEAPTGNPVILHFLERDIQEMQRLTKGQPNYFRKRIRLAVFEGAKVANIEVMYGGKMVAAQQITITPYADDPLRSRFEKFADKQYVFTLAPTVPGGLYAIRARINNGALSAQPLLLEELTANEAGSQPGSMPIK